MADDVRNEQDTQDAMEGLLAVAPERKDVNVALFKVKYLFDLLPCIIEGKHIVGIEVSSDETNMNNPSDRTLLSTSYALCSSYIATTTG